MSTFILAWPCKYRHVGVLFSHYPICKGHRQGGAYMQVPLRIGYFDAILPEFTNNGTVYVRADIVVAFRIKDPDPQAHIP